LAAALSTHAVCDLNRPKPPPAPRAGVAPTSTPTTHGQPVRSAHAARLIPTYPLAATLMEQPSARGHVALCQFDDSVRCGVDCSGCPNCRRGASWRASRPIPWEVFAQGEYIGPSRVQHVPEYQVRVDDVLELVYWFTYEASDEAYRFQIGDQLMIESLSDPNLNRGDLTQGSGLMIQPDGTITVRLLGQVPAAGRTVEELRADLERRYLDLYKIPSITVTPLQTNARLEALRSAIDARFGQGGQVRRVTVTPEGTIQLPGLPSAPAQGLSLAELERETEERYAAEFGPGVNVTVFLVQRAPRFVYVVGEVAHPGRFVLDQPTTAIQALSMAGSWKVGANLHHIVILRRTEDWCLIATKLDLYGALFGKTPCPADEIWLRDSDVVIVPQGRLLQMDNLIELVFTRGLYGVIPFQGVSANLGNASTL